MGLNIVSSQNVIMVTLVLSHGDYPYYSVARTLLQEVDAGKYSASHCDSHYTCVSAYRTEFYLEM